MWMDALARTSAIEIVEFLTNESLKELARNLLRKASTRMKQKQFKYSQSGSSAPVLCQRDLQSVEVLPC